VSEIRVLYPALAPLAGMKKGARPRRRERNLLCAMSLAVIPNASMKGRVVVSNSVTHKTKGDRHE